MENLIKPPNLSKIMHALIYFMLAFAVVLQTKSLPLQSVLAVTLEALLAFIGSVSVIFMVKFLSAASGSASGARVMRTTSNTDFWIKVGIGLAFSLVFSPSVHRNLPASWALDINSVYYTLGCVGVLVVKAVTGFFRRIGDRSDDVADAASDTLIENINRFGKRKQTKDKTPPNDAIHP